MPERPLADKTEMGLSPFHRLYRLRDGWIYIAAQSDAHRAAVLGAAGLTSPMAAGADGLSHPALASSTAAAAALTKALADQPVTATIAALRRSSVPVAEVKRGDSEVFLADSQAIENGHVTVRAHPTAGQITVAWQYIQFGTTKPSIGRPTPLLGEHSAEILSEVGYSDPAAAEVIASGVVKTLKLS